MQYIGPSTISCLGIGFGAGVGYFVGLWWTVRRLGRLRRPAFWIPASFILRTGLVLIVFYAAAQGQGDRILFCLAGFTLARILLLRRMGPGREDNGRLAATGARMPTNTEG